MTNEKAIEWLMHYITKDCENCDGVQNFGCDSKCFSLRALDIAIEALEKQTDKKPIKNTGQINKYWSEDAYLCHDCKTVVVSCQNYCDNCGLRIDWSDLE